MSNTYERISIHEGVKSHQLLKRLRELNTSEVVDIISQEGEYWFIQITFKDNKILMLSNNLPPHFMHQESSEVIQKRDNDLYFGIIKP